MKSSVVLDHVDLHYIDKNTNKYLLCVVHMDGMDGWMDGWNNMGASLDDRMFISDFLSLKSCI